MKQSSLGSLIRTLRQQNGMTQVQLAEQLCITDKAVSKWERGISYPDISLFPKLADALGVTINDLLEESIDDGSQSRLLQIFEMSHDIRTPLHIILGYAIMAKNNPDDREQLLRYLDNISMAGEYLLNVIDRAMQTTFKSKDDISSMDYPLDANALESFLKERISAREDAPVAYDFSEKRVLVAEDMGINREIAANILGQTGIEIEFANDGLLCLEKIKSKPAGYYDLILMDILMPNMDGIEATRQIRSLSDDKKASIPIIAMTANVYEKDRNAAFDAGMNDFTEKPIVVDKLFSTMKQFLYGS